MVKINADEYFLCVGYHYIHHQLIFCWNEGLCLLDKDWRHHCHSHWREGGARVDALKIIHWKDDGSQFNWLNVVLVHPKVLFPRCLWQTFTSIFISIRSFVSRRKNLLRLKHSVFNNRIKYYWPANIELFTHASTNEASITEALDLWQKRQC